MSERGWNYYRAGKVEEAINEFKKDVRKTRSVASYTALGFCYLGIGQTGEARRTFEKLIESHPESSAGFEWGGVCLWAQEKPGEAVTRWKTGLGSGYTDQAGGIQIPLFLFFSATRDSTLFDIAEATGLIRKKLATRWADNWPAPIGRYLIGDITEKQLRKEAQTSIDGDELTNEELIKIEFYKGVRLLHRGDKRVFQAQMTSCANMTNVEDELEFYLSRHEIQNTIDHL